MRAEDGLNAEVSEPGGLGTEARDAPTAPDAMPPASGARPPGTDWHPEGVPQPSGMPSGWMVVVAATEDGERVPGVSATMMRVADSPRTSNPADEDWSPTVPHSGFTTDADGQASFYTELGCYAYRYDSLPDGYIAPNYGGMSRYDHTALDGATQITIPVAEGSRPPVDCGDGPTG